MTRQEVFDEAWRLANPLRKESVEIAFKYIWNCALESKDAPRPRKCAFYTSGGNCILKNRECIGAAKCGVELRQ